MRGKGPLRAGAVPAATGRRAPSVPVAAARVACFDRLAGYFPNRLRGSAMSAAGGHGAGAGRGMREISEIDAAVLSALFESPISLYVLDPELRLVRFNPSTLRVRDFPIAE